MPQATDLEGGEDFVDAVSETSLRRADLIDNIRTERREDGAQGRDQPRARTRVQGMLHDAKKHNWDRRKRVRPMVEEANKSRSRKLGAWGREGGPRSTGTKAETNDQPEKHDVTTRTKKFSTNPGPSGSPNTAAPSNILLGWLPTWVVGGARHVASDHNARY